MIFEDKHHRYIQTLTYATGLCWLCCMLSSLSLVITFTSQTSQIAFAFGITAPQHWRWDEGFSSAAHSNGSCQGCGHGRLGREKCSRMSGVEFQSNQRWSRSESCSMLQFQCCHILPHAIPLEAMFYAFSTLAMKMLAKFLKHSGTLSVSVGDVAMSWWEGKEATKDALRTLQDVEAIGLIEKKCTLGPQEIVWRAWGMTSALAVLAVLAVLAALWKRPMLATDQLLPFHSFVSKFDIPWPHAGLVNKQLWQCYKGITSACFNSMTRWNAYWILGKT